MTVLAGTFEDWRSAAVDSLVFADARSALLATRYREGVQAAIDRHGMPWCIVQLGARAEYHFYPEPPVSGGQAEAMIDAELDDYLHLYTLNRGIVMTPFHNMALMCPATTAADASTVAGYHEVRRIGAQR